MPRIPRSRCSSAVGALLAGLCAACGDDVDDDVGSGLLIMPAFELGDTTVGCEDVPGVETLEVGLFDATGLTPGLGFPRTLACGPISLDALGGPSVLELTARGPLGTEPDARLFASRGPLEPDAGQVDMVLRPEVAFVELDWGLIDRQLQPCSDEVLRVDVSITPADGQAPAFRASYDCGVAPVRVSEPFRLGAHVFDLQAISSEGFPVYFDQVERFLDRGLNQYSAFLAPLGGQLLFDWQFALEEEVILACDDARVAVDAIDVSVRRLTDPPGPPMPDGSPPQVQTFPCSAPRPTVFSGARFRAGRVLELEMVAEGQHRFLALERIEMPDGDALLDVSTLDAVGTATVTLDARSAACSGDEGVLFDFEVFPEGASDPIRVLEIEATRPAVELADLPYGQYRLRVRRRPEARNCRPFDGTRAVHERFVVWEPLVF